MITEVKHLIFGMAVSSKNVNQLCMFIPGDGPLQRMVTCYLYLNTWRQIKFRRNCQDRENPTTWHLEGCVRFKSR